MPLWSSHLFSMKAAEIYSLEIQGKWYSSLFHCSDPCALVLHAAEALVSDLLPVLLRWLQYPDRKLLLLQLMFKETLCPQKFNKILKMKLFLLIYLD